MDLPTSAKPEVMRSVIRYLSFVLQKYCKADFTETWYYDWAYRVKEVINFWW